MQNVDTLIFLITSGPQSEQLMKDLRQESFHFTVIDSTGGIIRESQVCLLLGLENKRMPILSELMRRNCQPYRQYIPTQARLPGDLTSMPMVEAQMGGALVYMMNVERFEQF
jgi:uncharacterized protein YaaQ